MDDKTRINYNLVAQSSKSISKAAEEERTTSGVEGELSNIITSIINEGRDHDNCLAPFQGALEDIVNYMEKSITEMDNLSNLCMVVFDAFLAAEADIVDGVGTITINGTEFTNVKIESSGMKEYVNSMLDTNDLINSVSQESLDGPLSEEEWKRYELMFTKAMNECSSRKEKAAVAAIFMTSVYPHIPYDWGGGHYPSDVSSEDSINRHLGETYRGIDSTFQENPRLHTYDCSGFTSWVLKEAGYPDDMWTYTSDGTKYPTNVDGIVSNSSNRQQFGPDYDIDNTSVGDICYMHDEEPGPDVVDDHIGVVVAKEGDVITVAHVSAGHSDNRLQSESAGAGYTKINVKTGEVLEDSTSKRDDRVGKVYFTHTASME